MTLTPRRQPKEQDRRADGMRPAGVADGEALECGGPTFSEILGEMSPDLNDNALAALFARLADLPDDALEVEGPDEETSGSWGGVPEAPEASGGAVTADTGAAELPPTDRWNGRNLWEASAYAPEAKAEIQRLAAQLDAERAEWMRKRSYESEAERSVEYAAYLERNPEIQEQREREDEEWRQLLDDFDERAAEKARVKSERAERHREIARNPEPVGDAHPLLDQYRWSDLKGVAPELTDGVEGLQALLGELHSFTRPMGPDSTLR